MTWNEVPLNPPEQGQQPGGPPKFAKEKKRHGCLIGCLVFVVLLIVGAVLIGLFLRHTYNSWVNGDNTTTTIDPNAPPPVQVTAVQYGQLVGSHASVLEGDAQRLGEQCRNVVSNKAPCQTELDAFHTDLTALQKDLNGVIAPPDLSKTDAQLRKAVNDGANGSNNISTGLNGHPLTLVKGVSEVGRAATELKDAEQQLNAIVPTSTTLKT